MQAWNRFREFLQTVVKELKRTSFPTKKEVQGTTMVVVIMVLIMAVYLGLVDAVFGFLARLLLVGGAA